MNLVQSAYVCIYVAVVGKALAAILTLNSGLHKNKTVAKTLSPPPPIIFKIIKN